MNLKNLRNEWLQLLILAVPFCAVALLWDKLPYWVPVHWNIHGKVDGYERKAFGTLIVPVINVITALVVGLLPLIDPKLQKNGAEVRASLWRTVKIVRLGITGFLSLTSLAMLAAAMGWFSGAQFSYGICAGVAVLFILLGNLMTKLRPNYFIGIRTPWTLESKEVWTKTHRTGGRMMVLGGCVMLVLCFVVPLEQYAYWVVLPVVGALSIFSILYSYLLYKKQRLAPSISP